MLDVVVILANATVFAAAPATIRFSLLNQEHVKLLERMEQECRAGSNPLSKNKLIIRCIEEHYTELDSRQTDETLEERLEEYVDGEIQKIKQEIEMQIYKDVFHMFTGGLAAAGNQRKPAASEITAGVEEKTAEQTGHLSMEEIDLSENADIMDDIMKWS